MADATLQYHDVGEASALGEDEAMQAIVGSKEICVINLGGQFYAIDDICTHAYASLADGYVEGDQIECPLHGACFDIRTGKVRGAPATEDLKAYPVKVEGNRILIGLPAE
jgi:nitrite reductase/ring-hydroxylating ferredoxin subunit